MPGDLAGFFESNSSLIQAPGGAFVNADTETQFAVDPLLGALANNGGPTLTHALLTGSPAKDRGFNAGYNSFDQRGPGFARFSGLEVDVGAFEAQETPQTFIVTNLNDDGAGSLRAAIEAANNFGGPDTIQFQAGLTGTIALTSGEIGIYDAVTIPGPGAAAITVSGEGNSRIFRLYSPSAFNLTISGLTLSNASTNGSGGAIDGGYSTDIDLSNVVLSGNTSSSSGGGVHLGFGRSLTVTNATFSGNRSYYNGGGIYGDGNNNITITNSVFSGNAADGGGALFLDDANDGLNNLTIAGSTFSGNAAFSNRGGALYVTGNADTTITNSIFSGNTSSSGGGVAYLDGTVTIDASTFSDNTANDGAGGALAIESTSAGEAISISNSIFMGNVSNNSSGGALYIDSASANTVSIHNCTVTGNRAARDGGGIYFYNTGLLDLTDSVISNNSAGAEGGGIYIDGSQLASVINSCVIANNQAGEEGGGIFFDDGTLTIKNTTFANNRAQQEGGGVYIDNGMLRIENTTLSGNDSGNEGGGIYIDGGTLTLVNSTVSGNSAGGGGGVYVDGGTANIYNTTIANNTARYYGGGVYRDGGTVNLISTIVAGNTAVYAGNGNDIYGSVNARFTLIGNSQDALITETSPGTNILNQAPNLTPLQDNGGPTLTQALLAGSPGINAGSNELGLTTDQRGFTRVSGAAADIGATENQPFTTASAGGPYTISEGQSLKLEGVGDVDNDPQTFTWDINGDGVFGDATGQNPLLDATALAALGISDGPATFNVKVRVTSGATTIDSPASVLTLNNAAPIVVINGASASANEGAVLQLTAGITEPSAADIAAGLTFNWTVTKDGAPFATSTAATFPLTLGGNGTYAVTLQVTDKDGGTGTDTATIVVNNLFTSPATATPSAAGVGQVISFSAPVVAGATVAWEFGDGTTGSGATVTHSYAAAGAYVVKVTAVDATGNTTTQSLTVVVSAPLIGTGPDSDGDGFSDDFEIASGSDPLGTGSTPLGTITAGATTPQPLPDVKLAIKLNFGKPGNDSIGLSAILVLPQGFNPAGQTLILNIGGILKTFTLDAKGSAKSGGDAAKVTAKKGALAKTAKLQAKFSKGNFAAALADEGLTNSTVKGKPVTVPISALLGNNLYVANQPQIFSAKAGKAGATKQPK